jgi:hypothetical protein
MALSIPIHHFFGFVLLFQSLHEEKRFYLIHFFGGDFLKERMYHTTIFKLIYKLFGISFLVLAFIEGSSIGSFAMDAVVNGGSQNAGYNPKVGFFVAFLTFFLNYIYDLVKSKDVQTILPQMEESNPHLERYPVHSEPLEEDSERLEEDSDFMEEERIPVENMGSMNLDFSTNQTDIEDENTLYEHDFDLDSELYDEELFGIENGSFRDPEEIKKEAETLKEDIFNVRNQKEDPFNLENQEENLWEGQAEFLQKLKYSQDLLDFNGIVPGDHEGGSPPDKDPDEMDLWEEDDFDLFDDFEKFGNHQREEIGNISEEDDSFSEDDLKSLYQEIQEDHLFPDDEEDGKTKREYFGDTISMNEDSDNEDYEDDISNDELYKTILKEYNQNHVDDEAFEDLGEQNQPQGIKGLDNTSDPIKPKEIEEIFKGKTRNTNEGSKLQVKPIVLEGKNALGVGEVLETPKRGKFVKVLDSDHGEVVFENIAATHGIYSFVISYSALIVSTVEVVVNDEKMLELDIMGEGDMEETLQSFLQVELKNGLNKIKLINPSYQNVLLEKIELHPVIKEGKGKHGVA